MDKLGVVLDEEKTKQAGTQLCSSCGKSFGIIPAKETDRCPHCGSTKNFEKRPEK